MTVIRFCKADREILSLCVFECGVCGVLLVGWFFFLKVLLNFEMLNEMLHFIFWILQKNLHSF